MLVPRDSWLKRGRTNYKEILSRSARPSADRGDRQAKGPRIMLKGVLLLQLPDQAIDFVEAFLLNARREGFRLVGLARENRRDELRLARGLKLTPHDFQFIQLRVFPRGSFESIYAGVDRIGRVLHLLLLVRIVFPAQQVEESRSGLTDLRLTFGWRGGNCREGNSQHQDTGTKEGSRLHRLTPFH